MKSLFSKLLAAGLMLVITLLSPSVLACGCGCGTYNVGTSYNFPEGPGGMVWTEYDYIGQSQNWHGLGPAGADNNPHKLIQTSWLQGGMQYFFNNKWGASLVVPSANRIVRAETENGMEVQQGAPAAGGGDAPAEAPAKPSIATKQWWSMGDIRLNGYYTGFSPDMSTGVNLGMKFATGTWTVPDMELVCKRPARRPRHHPGWLHPGTSGQHHHRRLLHRTENRKGEDPPSRPGALREQGLRLGFRR